MLMSQSRALLFRSTLCAVGTLLCLDLIANGQEVNKNIAGAASGLTQTSPAKLINLIPIDTAPFQEPNLSLKGFLSRLDDVLRKQGKNVPVHVDFQAFKDANPDVYKELSDLYDIKVQIPAVPRRLTLGEIIKAAISHIPTNNGAHFVRKRQVWITTLALATPEALMQASVTAQFDQCPLTTAVREFSEMSGVTIVLDPRIGKAETPVTATFDNRVPLRTALALLADMTGQKVFEMNGALYLTTPENAKTLLKDLLPIPPQNGQLPVRPLVEDLSQVPEVLFEQPLARKVDPRIARARTVRMIANINLLNRSKSDHFVEMLQAERADLAGLAIVMGEACRTSAERSAEFKQAVAVVRAALEPGSVIGVPATQPVQTNAEDWKSFWERYKRGLAEEKWKLIQSAFARANEDEKALRKKSGQDDLLTCARIAALMQVLAPEPSPLRLGLVKYLEPIAHVDATRALARLALFSAEDDVRAAAVNGLKGRPEGDYTAILLDGFHYPLPVVARRASEAVIKLQRKDLLPQLVNLLDESDPRAPAFREVQNKRVPIVREIVRINHHRNCLLCHGPVNISTAPPDTFTAPIPTPGEALRSASFGYSEGLPPDVRVDVTYLRQDFSRFLPVADAAPWPETQRFDFLVRTRIVTDQEAKAIEEMLDKRPPGALSPYHRAVLAALRELTGRDTEPTPQAWRRLLGMSPRKL
jgi:hypothetical protein